MTQIHAKNTQCQTVFHKNLRIGIAKKEQEKKVEREGKRG